nr:hypothetical protein [Tanacetum cinerariifolium]
SSSESSDGTSGTPGLEPVPSSVPEPRVIALAGCLPLVVADSLGVDSTVVVGVGVGGVVEEAKSPFFFLALDFSFGVASPVAQA